MHRYHASCLASAIATLQHAPVKCVTVCTIEQHLEPKWDAQGADIAFGAPAARSAIAYGAQQRFPMAGDPSHRRWGEGGAPKPAADGGAGKGMLPTGRGTAPGAAKRSESITNDRKLIWPRNPGST